jgi:hypothetical protein
MRSFVLPVKIELVIASIELNKGRKYTLYRLQVAGFGWIAEWLACVAVFWLLCGVVFAEIVSVLETCFYLC